MTVTVAIDTEREPELAELLQGARSPRSEGEE